MPLPGLYAYPDQLRLVCCAAPVGRTTRGPEGINTPRWALVTAEPGTASGTTAASPPAAATIIFDQRRTAPPLPDPRARGRHWDPASARVGSRHARRLAPNGMANPSRSENVGQSRDLRKYLSKGSFRTAPREDSPGP